jgi:hypothetical protein
MFFNNKDSTMQKIGLRQINRQLKTVSNYTHAT